MGAVPWILVTCCTVFLIVWMALTFTNQFCATGPVAFGLCYKSADDPACQVCSVSPSPSPGPAQAPGPVAASPNNPCPAGQTSCYMPEPYDKE